MTDSEIDLLTIDRGLVVAPAGCGKTQLITDAVRRHSGSKPVLVLTHTNAGVAAIRNRLNKAGVNSSAYRLTTIDGWAIRLISMFPERAGHDPKIIESQRPNYAKIREASFKLLEAGHIDDIIGASYDRLLVDEYQDCSIRQHAIVYYASATLRTCVVGDPLQAIFGFGNDPLAEWKKHVCSHFPHSGELTRPWRWINANAEELGAWLLDARQKLLAGEAIDLRGAPKSVHWVELDGSAGDHGTLLEACRTKPPDGSGSVLIVGKSTSPGSQRRFASQTPGAVTVEAVDLRDLVSFARDFDIDASDALEKIATFAQSLMTNVGGRDLLRRVETLTQGRGRKEPNEVEAAALSFQTDRSYARMADLLVAINKDVGVRTYRPAIVRNCMRALQSCQGDDDSSFHEATIRIREQNRLLGRTLPKRAVGSTLLLKGLEAEVVVVLNADTLDQKNLYVAMTRGSKQLVLCSRYPVLNPKP